MSRTPLLLIQNLSRRFGGLSALEGVDLAVGEGEVVGLIGPNGAGKTTLFNCLNGLVQPGTGTIRFAGADLVPPLPPGMLARLRGLGCFFAFFSAPWTLAVAGFFGESAPFPLESALAAAALGAFRALTGLSLARAAPWARGLTLLFAGTDALLGARWLLLPGWMAEGRTFWGFFPLEYLVIPAALAMVSYPAVFLLFLARRDAGSLFGVFLRPDEITVLGCARTFQNIRLFANLSALDNVKVGRHCRTESRFPSIVAGTRAQRREEEETEDAAMECLGFVGLAHRAHQPAGSLPYGDQRRLEIARALATEPALLLLDEPAAGMNPQESADLMELIRRIRGKGTAVLLIEHDMGVVMRVSDRVVVLDHGQKIAEGTPEEVRSDPRVIEAYLGTSRGRSSQGEAHGF